MWMNTCCHLKIVASWTYSYIFFSRYNYLYTYISGEKFQKYGNKFWNISEKSLRHKCTTTYRNDVIIQLKSSKVELSQTSIRAIVEQSKAFLVNKAALNIEEKKLIFFAWFFICFIKSIPKYANHVSNYDYTLDAVFM